MAPGKRFEEDIVQSIDKEIISFTRLYDNTAGFATVANICDFVLYKYPIQIFLEAKSVKEGTFDFGNILEGKYRGVTKVQYEGMIEKSKISGVQAGILLEYRKQSTDEDRDHFFIPIQELEKWVNEGKKSMNVKDIIKTDALYVTSRRKVTRYTILIEDLLFDLLDLEESRRRKEGLI